MTVGVTAPVVDAVVPSAVVPIIELPPLSTETGPLLFVGSGAAGVVETCRPEARVSISEHEESCAPPVVVLRPSGFSARVLPTGIGGGGGGGGSTSGGDPDVATVDTFGTLFESCGARDRCRSLFEASRVKGGGGGGGGGSGATAKSRAEAVEEACGFPGDNDGGAGISVVRVRFLAGERCPLARVAS